MRVLMIGGTGTISTGIRRQLMDLSGFRVTVPWVETARRVVGWLSNNNRLLERNEDVPLYDCVIAEWQRATGALGKVGS
jgi:hypothetical protein